MAGGDALLEGSSREVKGGRRAEMLKTWTQLREQASSRGAAQQPPNTDALPAPSSWLLMESHVEDTCTPVQGMPQSLNLNMRKQLDNSDRVFHRTVARLFRNICVRKARWEGPSKVRD